MAATIPGAVIVTAANEAEAVTIEMPTYLETDLFSKPKSNKAIDSYCGILQKTLLIIIYPHQSSARPCRNR